MIQTLRLYDHTLLKVETQVEVRTAVGDTKELILEYGNKKKTTKKDILWE